MNMCFYGCGQEAKFYFKQAKKWCCSRSKNSCPEQRRILSERNKGKKPSELARRRSSEKNKGRVPWNKNKKDVYSKETLKNMSSSQLERFSKEEEIEKIRNSHKGQLKTSEFKESRRLKMLDGQAVWMLKFVKKISNEQLKLLNIIQKICPYVEHNYPIYRVGSKKWNYSIDITVPKLDLAIEFDGWFHFDTEEHKERDRKRQKEIEEEGWKFLRYNIFQKFPTLEQVKKDIKEILHVDD